MLASAAPRTPVTGAGSGATRVQAPARSTSELAPNTPDTMNTCAAQLTRCGGGGRRSPCPPPAGSWHTRGPPARGSCWAGPPASRRCRTWTQYSTVQYSTVQYSTVLQPAAGAVPRHPPHGVLAPRQHHRVTVSDGAGVSAHMMRTHWPRFLDCGYCYLMGYFSRKGFLCTVPPSVSRSTVRGLPQPPSSSTPPGTRQEAWPALLLPSWRDHAHLPPASTRQNREPLEPHSVQPSAVCRYLAQVTRGSVTRVQRPPGAWQLGQRAAGGGLQGGGEHLHRGEVLATRHQDHCGQRLAVCIGVQYPVSSPCSPCCP